MKNLLSYAIALVFSLSVATATYAAPVAADGTVYCGDHEKGKKMSKKECKEKCKKGTAKKGCCAKDGATSKK